MKTKFVGFRLEEPLYRFLLNFGRRKKMTVTDVVRNLCTFMYFGCAVNKDKFDMRAIFSDKKRKDTFVTFIKMISK